MFHSILTILTTAVVGLNAILGCCCHSFCLQCPTENGAHNLISCVGEACCAVICGEDEENSESSLHVRAGSSFPPCDHSPKGCDDEKCNFVSILRSDRMEEGRLFSTWCKSLDLVSNLNASTGYPTQFEIAYSSIHEWSVPVAENRSILQVWRL
ncbi:hypothetical protein Pla110_41030 [Polystyrenella longa]|uniref:Uncharacterized protein n=1 Tax=Polystyrenella longa TaxID=2528007 RepID=A0A518CSZ1_9PLAN|nr:hypothetical protein Pla110_41030 [Polystyrenella longa]